MKSAGVSLAILCLWSAAVLATRTPTANTVNGTYQGRYLEDWKQDVFLGIPFAQPPVGDLRFRWPQPINTTFEGTRDATEYGYSCMQYRGSFNMSEDCLNLNVIRPSGNFSEPLPVLVWVFGGGLYTGSTADPQYNLTGIVRASQDMGRPVIAVDMSYRLNMYGFLQTPELLAEGSSNAGLADQRLALQWVQENIAAFGGDPEKVVIWGESAGAQSLAYHMISDGRDDGLFRGAILESGGPTGCQVQDLPYYSAAVENLTRTVGCFGASSQLACLRGLSQDELFAARPSQVWNPLIDGNFLKGYPSQMLREGNFVRVPLLIGANTDEGTGFSVPGVNTEEDLALGLLSWRMYALSPPTIRKFLELYPNDPCNEPPYAITNCSIFPSKSLQWRRGGAIGGDMVMISGRRKLCEVYAAADQAVYSYRFDTQPWDSPEIDGVQHFDNVAFSFQNISGLLGPSPEYDSHRKLATAIGQAYVNFVYDLDPNPRTGRNGSEGALPRWPRYELDAPTNMVLNASGSWVEDDTFRKEGIAYMNTYEVARELLA